MKGNVEHSHTDVTFYVEIWILIVTLETKLDDMTLFVWDQHT